MLSLPEIELQLIQAMKGRNKLAVEVWRGLKARLHNESIAQGKALQENRVLEVARSEVKRRHEAAESFTAGGRPELAEKELAEAKILQAYLPQAPAHSEIAEKARQIILQHQFTVQDFGKAMAELKKVFGAAADGAVLAKALKEQLNQ